MFSRTIDLANPDKTDRDLLAWAQRQPAWVQLDAWLAELPREGNLLVQIGEGWIRTAYPAEEAGHLPPPQVTGDGTLRCPLPFGESFAAYVAHGTP